MPETLYYLDRGSSTVHTSTPTGIIDVTAAVQSKLFWIKPDSETLKKKTLVLSDWTACEWEYWKPQEVVSTFKRLLKEGFELYVVQLGELVKFSFGMIHKLDKEFIREQITPLPKKEILEKMAEKKLSAKQIICITTEKLNALLVSPEALETVKKGIKFSEICCVARQMDRSKLMAHMLSEHEGRIVLDAYGVHANSQLEAFQRNFDIHSELRYEEALESFGDIDYRMLPTVSQLCREKALRNVKKITLVLKNKESQVSHVDRARDLSNLFNHSGSTLEELEVTGDFSYGLTPEVFPEGGFPRLHTLILARENEAIIPDLLNKTKALKFLRLLPAQGDSAKDPPTLFSTQHSTGLLKTLQTFVSYGALSRTDILSVLQYAKKLKTVWFCRDCVLSKEELEKLRGSSQSSFECLETIQVYASRSNATWIEFLLSNSPHVQNLEIIGSSSSKHDQFCKALPKKTLETLKAISFYAIVIPEGFWDVLCNHFKNLEEMTLAYVTTPPLPETVVRQLKSLTLTHMKSETIKDLLSKASALEALSLQGEVVELRDTPEENFKNLIALATWEVTISNEDLTTLLKQSKCLKSIGLGSVKHSDSTWEGHQVPFDFGGVPDENFKHLKKLDLFDCYLEFETLSRILQCATNLEILSIDKALLKGYTLRDFEGLGLNKKVWQLLEKEFSRLAEGEKKSVSEIAISRTQNQPKNSETSDFDTSNEVPTTFKTTRVFFDLAEGRHPEIFRYRTNVYDVLEVDDIGQKPLTLGKTENLKLIPINHSMVRTEVDTSGCYARVLHDPKKQRVLYAKNKLRLSAVWQPLPGLTPVDRITHLHILGVRNDQVEIQYSEAFQQYYIRSLLIGEAEKVVEVDFLLTVPNYVPIVGENCSIDIKNLIQTFRGFGEGALQLDSARATTRECLEAIKSQKKGACRHRAVAFFDYCKKHCPQNPVRIVSNDSHAFVELFEDDLWHTCDLGGYEANLDIDDSHHPAATQREPAIEKMTMPACPTAEVFCGEQEQKIRKETTSIETSRFNTWRSKESSAPTIAAYCQEVLCSKSTLIKFNNQRESDACNVIIQNRLKHMGKSVFYVNSPEDLVCSAPWIRRDPRTNKGELQSGPGGRLYDFLNHLPENPVMVINWDNFETEDIIKYNSMLDITRQVEGVNIPEGVKILGLYNKNRPGAYTGSDFTSRFDKISDFNFDEVLVQDEALRLKNNIQPLSELPAGQAVEEIDLFESGRWCEILCGQWVLQGKSLVFTQGKLVAALKTGKAINLKNAPWEDPKFTKFWEQAFLTGTIDIPGEKIHLSDSQKSQCYQSAGYAWQTLTSNIVWGPVQSTSRDIVHMLNPAGFNEFIASYAFKEGDFFAKPGLLEQAKNGSLCVCVSRAISAHQWGQFLNTARKNNVRLSIELSSGISLPFDREHGFAVERKVKREQKAVEEMLLTADNQTQIFVCEDLDYALATLARNPERKRKQETKMIDVSECDPSDLLVAFSADFNEQKLSFEFRQQTQVVLKALKAGETVILKGKFKPELADALSSFCMSSPSYWSNGKRETYTGKLVLLTDNEKTFSFTRQRRVALPKSKRGMLHILQKQYSGFQFQRAFNKLKKMSLSERSFVQIESALIFLRHHPALAEQDNWVGLRGLDESSFANLTTFDLSVEACVAFQKKRLKKIEAAFARNPFVFIAGSTGIGKSTFVLKELTKKPCYKVLVGEKNLATWARDTTSQKEKILFIDEANIDVGDFSAFEGLFNHPPGMLIEGVYQQLTSKHKVIFAGNPLSYGARNIPALFERRGGSVLFEQMEPAYLFHKVLKPIFSQTSWSEEEQNRLGQKLLLVYQKVCEIAGDTVTISARELQMMAMLLILHPKHPDYCIHSVASNLLVGEKKNHFSQWYQEKISNHLILPEIKARTEEFILTKSRRLAYQQLSDLLSVRHLKQKTTNKVIQTGGLGGMILEGAPGTGKTKFVIEVLLANNFVKASPKQEKPPKKHWFYSMPVSMSYPEKEALLLRAFHEGSVVVVDEINSAPMLERLLNALLMGTDLQGHRAKHPGFMLIGTQNPITMEGRVATSSALDRRLIKTAFPNYTREEMFDILQAKQIERQRLISLINDYDRCYQFAVAHNKQPLPTFRDLESNVDAIIESKRRTMVAVPSVERKIKQEVLDANVRCVQTNTTRKPLRQYLKPKAPVATPKEETKVLQEFKQLLELLKTVGDKGTRIKVPQIEKSIDSLKEKSPTLTQEQFDQLLAPVQSALKASPSHMVKFRLMGLETSLREKIKINRSRKTQKKGALKQKRR